MSKKNINKTRFEKDLEEKLKDKEFRQYYDEFGKQFEIAYKLLCLRKEANMSQAKFARKIGTTQSNVARMEKGNQNFTISTLEKIAKVFNKKLFVAIK